MADVIALLERDTLRNIVLLKHLEAFSAHCHMHQVADVSGDATLVLLDVAASPYDTRTYPSATYAALISSDRPELTSQVLAFVPQHVGVVFKLNTQADCDVVAASMPVRQTTRVLSFTAASPFLADANVRVALAPSEHALELFEAEKHSRDWLLPLLQAEKAFACVLEQHGRAASVCFAFENYKQVWEIGGVVTPAPLRGRGLASRVVRTALAEIERRRLISRYQAHDDNVASIALARTIGLKQFLTITHLLREPVGRG
jgi:RimJ/RimL family protein N-acetyltransferase